MSMELSGKAAIVTGGARGIGRGIAVSLARAGVDVVIGDLTDISDLGRDARETAAAIEALGRRARIMRCDVTRSADCEALAAAALREFGRLDIVCPNAGVLSGFTVLELTLEEWERILRVNLTGTFLTCKAALPHLIARGGGAIVNTASSMGLKGAAQLAHYSASKFGVVGFTQALAAEVAAQGIRVNCVCPSSVRTQLSLDEMRRRTGVPSEKADRHWTKATAERLPLKKSVEPEDIGEAVVYLCRADQVTGIALEVTGGEQLL
jgi:meso-butanediol dehydrogenase / (S,S)-butanediol dehydrogenase / diacetyl reductase